MTDLEYIELAEDTYGDALRDNSFAQKVEIGKSIIKEQLEEEEKYEQS